VREPTALETGGPGRLKSALFAVLVPAALFLLAEGFLAAVGVVPVGNDSDSGFSSRIPLYRKVRDASGTLVYETAPNKLRFFNEQRFAATKPGGTRRLFCIGGSTTYGRPFRDPTSFCGWLRRLLAEAEPERPWEVVNAGGISYASYRAAAVVDELAAYEPDVFVIYSGHNEFLERRTWSRALSLPAWLRNLDAVMRRTRVYTSLRGVIQAQRRKASAAPSAEVDTLLDQSVGLDAYTRDNELRARVIAEYEAHLGEMISMARSVGAEPIIVIPASNSKDCTPFKSEHGGEISPEASAAWREAYRAGRQALRSGNPDVARRHLAEAVELDSRRADSQFLLGRALFQLGDRDAADQHFRRAREEDVCPLRAIEPLTAIAREMGSRWDVMVVDYPALLVERQGSSPLGADFFLDHVHPTIDAHGLLAAELFETLHRGGFVQAELDARILAAVSKALHASLAPRESGLAMRNLAKVLSWAGKTEDAARAAEAALELLEEDAESEFILAGHASDQGRDAEALERYRAALSLEPDYIKARNNLGITLVRLGRYEEAIDAYEHVLTEMPSHTGARFNLANTLVKMNRTDAAIANYLEILEEHQDDNDAHYNLAQVYFRRGELEMAAEHYRAVLQNDPGADDAREGLKTVLSMQEPT